MYWGAESDLRTQFYAFFIADCWFLFIEWSFLRQMNLLKPQSEPRTKQNVELVIWFPHPSLRCTHRLCAGEGNVPDLLGDELQLRVVPLPLPLLPLQARDHLRPGHRHTDHHRHFLFLHLVATVGNILTLTSWISNPGSSESRSLSHPWEWMLPRTTETKTVEL